MKIQRIDIMPDEKCGCPYKRIHECDVFMNGSETNLFQSVAWLPNNQSWDEFWASCQNRMRKRNHATARKGYYCKMINIADYLDDMYQINLSKIVRQGKPMSEGYFLTVEELRRAYASPDRYSCQLHTYRWFGVFTKEGRMVGYILWLKSGQLACYTMILGHGDYLKDEIMYFLHFYIQKVLRESKDECFKGVLGTAYYSFYSSGTQGLTFWKQQAGFLPYHLAFPNSHLFDDDSSERHLYTNQMRVGRKEERKHKKGQRPHP